MQMQYYYEIHPSTSSRPHSDSMPEAAILLPALPPEDVQSVFVPFSHLGISRHLYSHYRSPTRRFGVYSKAHRDTTVDSPISRPPQTRAASAGSVAKGLTVVPEPTEQPGVYVSTIDAIVLELSVVIFATVRPTYARWPHQHDGFCDCT